MLFKKIITDDVYTRYCLFLVYFSIKPVKLIKNYAFATFIKLFLTNIETFIAKFVHKHKAKLI